MPKAKPGKFLRVECQDMRNNVRVHPMRSPATSSKSAFPLPVLDHGAGGYPPIGGRFSKTGKNEGGSALPGPLEKIRAENCSMAALPDSAKLTALIDQTAFGPGGTQWVSESDPSRQRTDGRQMIRIGGCVLSMVRNCTRVWVRSRVFGHENRRVMQLPRAG